jgi:hypothetical protein
MQLLREVCDRLRCYAACTGSYVPMFRAHLRVPTSGVKQSKKILEEGTDRLSRNVGN